MPTIAETWERLKDPNEDPLFGDINELLEDNGSIFIPGKCIGGLWAEDLLITPNEDGWNLMYRDPANSSDEMWGRVWIDSGTHSTWDSLVTFAYEL